MKRMLAVAVAVAASALVAALPAAAQSWGGYGDGYGRQPYGENAGRYGHDYGYRYGYGYDARALADRPHRLEALIDRAAERGELNGWEARDLRSRVDAVEHLAVRYRWDGLRWWEVRDLDRRYDVIAAELRDRMGDDDDD